MTEFLKLSILMPAYNEEATIAEIIRRIDETKLDLQKELIVIDDGSTDNTKKILKKINEKYPYLKVFEHNANQGKGAAIKTALKKATGDIILIQDADLEYDPIDYDRLLQPILNGQSKVVYGSRNKMTHKHHSFLFYFGGNALTWITNILFKTNLTDMTTCYKLFKKEAIKDIKLTSDGFEFCPEITARLAKKGIKITEVPITYSPRSFKEGKKIKIKDGFKAFKTLLRLYFA